MMSPTRCDSSLFTWEIWCAGSIHELGLCCRYYDITSEAGVDIMRKHVVHWCPGESLPCRPKTDQVAVMCFKDGEHFWFHIHGREFDAVFPEIERSSM